MLIRVSQINTTVSKVAGRGGGGKIVKGDRTQRGRIKWYVIRVRIWGRLRGGGEATLRIYIRPLASEGLIRIKGRRYGVKLVPCTSIKLNLRFLDFCTRKGQRKRKKEENAGQSLRRWSTLKSLHAPLSGKWVHENPLTRQTKLNDVYVLQRVHAPRHGPRGSAM